MFPVSAKTSDEVIDLPTREGYDLWSQIYDEEDNPVIRLEESLINQWLGDVNGLSVLDLGCGTGRHSLSMSQAGAQVTAVDFSTGMLAKATAKPGADQIHFQMTDLTQPLPFESDSFDRILSCLVLEHILELQPIYAEMQRVCKPSGFVLITAMHPAMNLLGVQARFRDPSTAKVTRPQSAHHRIADYVMSALQVGLKLEQMSEHVVDEKLIAESPRGAKYLGWPLLLMLKFRAGQ